ncbi:unnamed protein product [Pleuronectes platessa]|uniref:Uncharacterized protein n=1 Tax=Pleuronectes platessa TaxID=8262 RepID=A0A9N7UM10_PLEPL|nr:unnamed protein product [Pleuronectes platessa]
MDDTSPLPLLSSNLRDADVSGVQLLPVEASLRPSSSELSALLRLRRQLLSEPEEDKQLQTTSHLKNTPEVAAGLLRVKRCFNLAAGPSASLQSAGRHFNHAGGRVKWGGPGLRSRGHRFRLCSDSLQMLQLTACGDNGCVMRSLITQPGGGTLVLSRLSETCSRVMTRVGLKTSAGVMMRGGGRRLGAAALLFHLLLFQ